MNNTKAQSKLHKAKGNGNYSYLFPLSSSLRLAFTFSEVLIAKRERGKMSLLNLSRTRELKAPSSRFLKQCAFTLAEVLITLGIIGVVAAMTIPTLMNDIQDTQYKTAYKKAYSTLSQALSQANTDNALLESSGAYDVNILTDFVTIMSYIKVQKTCYDYLTIGGAANNSQCWNRDGEGYNSSAYKNGSPMLYDLVAVDASGMSWATYARGYNYAILVDTNGMKPPNQMGKDRFIFALRDKAGNSGSVVSDVPIKVTPDSDNNSWTCNYNKCATENNYFPTTWLMK